MSSLTEKEEQFEWWVTIMYDRIKELKSELPGSLSDSLDFTVNSLDSLERYLLEHYPFEEIQLEKNKMLLDGLARYVGLTAQKNLKNAYWDMDLKNPENVFYLLPVVMMKDSKSSPLSPYTLVTALFDRKKGNYLSTVINSYIKNQGN
jgi:hypothetical protein